MSEFGVEVPSDKAAQLRILMREYEQAEALVSRALELSDKHQFLEIVALCLPILGQRERT
jgi:hypothetical protein